jgi:hypothetical protein
MPSEFDARIKLVYPVDSGTFFTVDDVPRGDTFDVVANVEIGPQLNGVVDAFDLKIGVVNLTQSKSVDVVNVTGALTPVVAPFTSEERVTIPAGWQTKADVGDVLQVTASYKVTAGANTDFSTAMSDTFVVS